MASSTTEAEALNAVLNLTEMIQERSFTSMATFFDDLFGAYSSNFNKDKEVAPDSIESTYTGMHINTKYEENDFLKMVDEFRNGNRIHAKYALQILRDSIALFEKYPNVRECAVKSPPGNCILVGDLHGSFKDLYYLIKKYGPPGRNHSFVFNGDFVDRGEHQVEVLLTLLYAHLMHPDRVFLNRGNHEDLSINLSKHFDPNYKQDVDQKYGVYAMAVFNQSQRLFRRLPVATIVENSIGLRVFVTHGGLSNRLNLDFIRSSQFNRFGFASVSVKSDQDAETRRTAEQFSDLLWSDPITSKGNKSGFLNGCMPNKQRGAGYLFGADVSEAFCKAGRFTMVVRSHEVRDEGFTQDHTHCGTIFSSSQYCGGSNKAAVLIIDPNQSGITAHKFKTNHLSKDNHESQKKLLLHGFKAYLDRESVEIYHLLRAEDPSKTGWISLSKWSNILSSYIEQREGLYISPAHLMALKDYLCPCDEIKAEVQYTAMFSRLFRHRESSGLFEFLGVVFNLIDVDKNGTISEAEARRAIELMNQKMGTKYGTEFISSMDSNRDGVIDIKEFQTGFSKAFSL
jgi:hypothetical protein